MTETRTYAVPDVSCEHCVAAITTEVTGVDGVTSVAVDLSDKTVTVIGGDDPAIRAAIDEAGYDIV
ncbi:MAG: heavy-metal-associated domain-containing protein [Actinomycetota bacterium]